VVSELGGQQVGLQGVLEVVHGEPLAGQPGAGVRGRNQAVAAAEGVGGGLQLGIGHGQAGLGGPAGDQVIDGPLAQQR
jgi:hypothetical protein